LKAGTNKCRFVCNVEGAKVPAKPVEKRLASSMKVSQLKIMIKKLFGVDPSRAMLYFKGESSQHPVPIEADVHSELGSGVIEGGEIIIEDVGNDHSAASVASASEQYGSVFMHQQFADSLYHEGSGLAAT